MNDDYLRYLTERKELISNILLISSNPPDNLDKKTISELMRIYYAGIDNKCSRCGHEGQYPPFKSIYRNNAS